MEDWRQRKWDELTHTYTHLGWEPQSTRGESINHHLPEHPYEKVTAGHRHTSALSLASPVMAAEMSDEATLAPSLANGIDSDPTAGGNRGVVVLVRFVAGEKSKAFP